jgi:hypothetical protein
MTNYDKTIPAGSTQFPTVDDNIRQNWDALEERLSAEHQFPSNAFTSHTSGRHKFGVGTTATRDATLTSPQSGMVWYNTSLGCWQIHNGSAWLPAGSGGVGTTAARDALTSVPTNFTWLSTDEGFSSYYSGTAWVTLAPKGLFHGRISYTSASTVTIGRGNAQKLRVEVDGVLMEKATDLVIDLASGTDRQDAAEAASTWYYLYIYNNAGVLTGKISSRVPIMDPASGKVGYHDGGGTGGSTTWRCIGAVFNDGSSNIQPFDRNADGWFQFRQANTASPFTQSLADPSALTSYTSLSMTNVCPGTARAARFSVYLYADNLRVFFGPEPISGTVSTNPTGWVIEGGAAGGSGRSSAASLVFDVSVDATPTVKYGSDQAASDFTSLIIRFIGWRDDLGLVT